MPFSLPVLVRLRRRANRLRNALNRGVHQRSHATTLNRYPAVFSAVAGLVRAETPVPAVLSFGCSTGEECRSLATHFPGAPITGTDISATVLKRARETCRDLPQLDFLRSPDLMASGRRFDAIFAMSVLCRHRETREAEDIAQIYPFADFARTATDLAGLTLPGGYLVLFNGNYRFEDVPAAADFAPVDIGPVRDRVMRQRVALFDPDGKRRADQSAGIVFRRNRD